MNDQHKIQSHNRHEKLQHSQDSLCGLVASKKAQLERREIVLIVFPKFAFSSRAWPVQRPDIMRPTVSPKGNRLTKRRTHPPIPTHSFFHIETMHSDSAFTECRVAKVWGASEFPQARADSRFYRVLLKLLGMCTAINSQGTLYSWPICT